MTELLEQLTNVAIALEAVAAVVMVVLNWREWRFLAGLSHLLADDESLPLYDALSFRARYITFVAIWLILLSALAAAGIRLTDAFPPLRAINGLLLLGLLAGPRQVGVALRKREAARLEGAD